jgi:uncharacterized protein
MTELEEKKARVMEICRGMGSALLAFSGGVDSSLLLAVASRDVTARLVAVTVCSPVHPAWEVEEAAAWAAGMGIDHRTMPLAILDVPGFASNGRDRCYRCKRFLMGRLKEMARGEGLAWVMEGSHAEDRADDRPGMKALEELGIRSPLREAGMLKSEIRQWARELGIPHWDRPSMACLATRIATGQRITPGKLARVERAEGVLRGMGFRQFRARYHGRAVRVQVGSEEVGRFLADGLREAFIEGMASAGFEEVWLDLRGYGSPGTRREPS